MRKALLALLYFLATAVALAFLTLPLLAIFVHVPPGRLIDQLSNPVVTDALIVSFKTTLIAQALVLLFGTPTAYLLASRRFPAARSASRSSSFRSCSRRPWPGSACWPRSAASACSARRLRLGRDHDPVHAERGHDRGRVRRQPALHPPGDRRLRGDRPEPRRRVAHARRRPGPHLLPRRAPPGARRSRRRRGARVRARARRVRRHDHVRRQPPER